MSISRIGSAALTATLFSLGCGNDPQLDQPPGGSSLAPVAASPAVSVAPSATSELASAPPPPPNVPTAGGMSTYAGAGGQAAMVDGVGGSRSSVPTPTRGGAAAEGGAAGGGAAGGGAAGGGAAGGASTPPVAQEPALPEEDPTLPLPTVLELEEVVVFPKSTQDPVSSNSRLRGRARINFVGEVPDGSGRLFVPDLNGMMYLVEDGNALPYLNVGEAFEPHFYASEGLGNGFGFVTFHPDFAQNGKFYTVHTENGSVLKSKPTTLPPQKSVSFHGVVTEWTAEDPSANSFSPMPGSQPRELLRLAFAKRIHGIQEIGFNPTVSAGHPDYGMLYVTAGDGGIGEGSSEPQDLSRPAGKLLRIDPLGSNSGNGQYGIPPDNPFVGEADALGEIFARGFRDPHRFSWDRGGDHRLFMGHIGQWRFDTIVEIVAGDNFGWSDREGRTVFDVGKQCGGYSELPANDADFGFVYPVVEYEHERPSSLGCSRNAGHAVAGGFVYRGPIAQLVGKYIFTDLVDGRVMFTREQEMVRGAAPAVITDLQVALGPGGEPTTMDDLIGSGRVDLRLGTDLKHDLYMISKTNGTLWRVTGSR